MPTNPLQIEHERQLKEFDEKVLEKKSVLSRAGIVGVPILFEEIEVRNIQTSCQHSTIEVIGKMIEELSWNCGDRLSPHNVVSIDDILSELNINK